MQSYSYAEVARRLGMEDTATPYKSIKPAIIELGLDTSHFRGQGWNAGGRSSRKAKPLEEYLVKGSRINSSTLKKRIIEAGLLKNECSATYCPVPNPSIDPFTGEQAELKLSLDHINGDNSDNRIENLRLLCYHCHGMTETWCRGQKPKSPQKTYLCVECFEPISRRAYVHKACLRCISCGELSGGRKNYCRPCGGANAQTKINWPPVEELLDMLDETNYTVVARQLGVSDNAIRKHIKNHDPTA